MREPHRQTKGVSWLRALVALGAITAVGLSSLASAQAAPGASSATLPLIFAKVSSDDQPLHLATRYGKLLQALGRELGRPVVFQTKGTYEQMATSMNRGAFDIVSAGPLMYLQHEDQYVPVARPMRRGKATYRGILLVRQEAKIKTIAQLRGHRLGFVSQRSTSGFLLPTLLMEQAGLSLKRDFKDAVTFYGGKHTEVVQALNRGEIDAGAVFDDARNDAFGQDKVAIAKTRIIARTEPIPTDPILVSHHVEPALREKITAFFVACGSRSDAKTILEPLDEQLDGWVATSAADYQPVRRYRKALARIERGEQ